MAPALSISLVAGLDNQQRYRIEAGPHGVRMPDLRLDAAGATVWLHWLTVAVETAEPPLEGALPPLLERAWRAEAGAVPGVRTVPATSAPLPAPVGQQEVTLLVTAEVQQRSISGDWVPRRVTVTERLRLAWGAPAAASVATPDDTVELPEAAAESHTSETQVPQTHAPERHHGILAVDFGTTACTATLWDETSRPTLPLPRSQTTVLRQRIAALLDEVGPGGYADPAWERLAATAAEQVLGADATRPTLAAALRRETDVSAPLLHETVRQLESQAPFTDDHLRDWLTGRLYAAHEESFAAPAPDRWNLHELPLSDKGESVLSSVVSVDGSGGVRVGPPKDDGEDLVLHGLKRHLGRPPGHRDLREKTDDTIVRAIADLVARSGAAIAKDPDLDHGPVGRVIVTYPTVLHGAARTALVEGVRRHTGVLEVNNRYDEAIAAGFYYLMRDIGGDPYVGIEALRARMRATNNPAAFTENLLVVDIGGGTTDIALFAMHLRDVSPVNAGATPFGPGKCYYLSPALRGSNGRENRGGDYITLCVFHWLKAAIADALLVEYAQGRAAATVVDAVTHMDKTGGWWRDGAPVPYALTTAELAYLNSPDRWSRGGQEAPPHRNAVEQLVPTRWREDPARRPAFQRLWQIAERVKIDYLGQDKDFTLAADQVDEVIGSGGVPVSLAAQEFRVLARSIVKRLATLAVELVVNRFGDRRERLDRLILTGRASALPLVREVFDEAFATAAREHPNLLWDPTALLLDVGHAKSATSIGAVWAERMRTLSRSHGSADQVVRDGSLDIRVDVDNVFQTLAASFKISVGADPEELFKANTEFLADGERRYLERDLGQLRRPINIHRVIEGDQDILWGYFDVANVADEEGYEPALPGSGREDDRWTRDKLARVEINPQLELVLRVWRTQPEEKRPLHVVPPAEGTRLAPQGVTAPMSAADAFALARRLRVAGGNAEHAPTRGVFPKLPESPAWTHRFWDDDAGVERNGLISSEPLPEADDQGWRFALVGDEAGAPAHRVAAPPASPRSGDKGWYASLDDQGVFRLHRTRPAYLKADTLRAMDERPGAVYTAQLKPRDVAEDNSDPFNGLQ